MSERSFGHGERIKLKGHGRDGFGIDREDVDIRYLEQLTDSAQTAALAHIASYAVRELIDGKRSIREILKILEDMLDDAGVEKLCDPYPFCGLARPRVQEISGMLNRCRFLRAR